MCYVHAHIPIFVSLTSICNGFICIFVCIIYIFIRLYVVIYLHMNMAAFTYMFTHIY